MTKMLTKKQMLEHFIKCGTCAGLRCDAVCPYNDAKHCLNNDLRRIGAIAILRQNRNRRVFDPDKVLTCATADRAKVGMRGYFSNNLALLKDYFKKKKIYELSEVYAENYPRRFIAENIEYALFYPIDEVEE